MLTWMVFLHTDPMRRGTLKKPIGEFAEALLEFVHNMSIQNRLVITLVSFLASMVFAGTASAQAGLACPGGAGGGQCGLGGQIRGQIGNGLPLPITGAPAQTGSFTLVTINNVIPPDGFVPVGKGLGQPGAQKPSPFAKITIGPSLGTPGNFPRTLMLKPGLGGGNWPYDASKRSQDVFSANPAIFAVQTDIIADFPHPGSTTPNFGPMFPGGPRGVFVTGITYSAGGRTGPAVVTWCPGRPFPTAGFNPGCAGPDAPNLLAPGLVRFEATKNQFGGSSRGGRAGGTARVFFVAGTKQPPCNGAGCSFNISEVDFNSTAAAGGPFDTAFTSNAAFTATNALFTGNVGFNGTIFSVGANQVAVPPTFVGQGAENWGVPATTGQLKVSVTQNLGPDEIFVRTGTDQRDADGNGVVALVTGGISKRITSGPNGNRTWITLEIPEPSAIFAASAGLFALFGCHQLVRRRSR